jgi:hypothetical protein
MGAGPVGGRPAAAGRPHHGAPHTFAAAASRQVDVLSRESGSRSDVAPAAADDWGQGPEGDEGEEEGEPALPPLTYLPEGPQVGRLAWERAAQRRRGPGGRVAEPGVSLPEGSLACRPLLRCPPARQPFGLPPHSVKQGPPEHLGPISARRTRR